MSHFTKPKDATHEWTAAYRPANKYYKFDVDKNHWLVYSDMFQVWRKSLNDEDWFERETQDNFFRPLTDNDTTATVASIQQKEQT